MFERNMHCTLSVAASTFWKTQHHFGKSLCKEITRIEQWQYLSPNVLLQPNCLASGKLNTLCKYLLHYSYFVSLLRCKSRSIEQFDFEVNSRSLRCILGPLRTRLDHLIYSRMPSVLLVLFSHYFRSIKKSFVASSRSFQFILSQGSR